jgi:dCTP deaminase
MLLSYTELLTLVEQGVIRNLGDISQVNAASIDLRLGPDFMFEKPPRGGRRTISIARRESLALEKKSFAMGSAPFLEPGEFCLAATLEEFHLPDDISAEFKLKSSTGRSGLNQLTAVWADAGWNNSVLTLELSNVTRFHNLELEVGMCIGQMIFHRHTKVPPEESYRNRGHYNGDHTVATVRPIPETLAVL